MFTQKLFVTAFLMPLFFLASCKSDKPDYTEKIKGKWEITQALRNGNDTPTLQGGFFEFEDSGKANVNLDGNPQTATYDLKDDKITISGSSTDGEYLIKALDAASMKLSVNIKGYEFEFDLKKAQ